MMRAAMLNVRQLHGFKRGNMIQLKWDTHSDYGYVQGDNVTLQGKRGIFLHQFCQP